MTNLFHLARKTRYEISACIAICSFLFFSIYLARSFNEASKPSFQGGTLPDQWQVGIGAIIFCISASMAWIFRIRDHSMSRDQARIRLRSAEDELARAISANSIHSELRELLSSILSQQEQDKHLQQPASVHLRANSLWLEHAEALPQTKDDLLALSALWNVTNSRLDLYHDIATSQARSSFRTAQGAIGAGFVMLVAFAVLSFRTHSTASAITTGALGAVSAALAGYIGKTFVRSQESAATHLRAYFDQPLEFSRYLAAERLLSGQQDLNEDQRAMLLRIVISAMVKAPEHSMSTSNSKRHNANNDG